MAVIPLVNLKIQLQCKRIRGKVKSKGLIFGGSTTHGFFSQLLAITMVKTVTCKIECRFWHKSHFINQTLQKQHRNLRANKQSCKYVVSTKCGAMVRNCSHVHTRGTLSFPSLGAMIQRQERASFSLLYTASMPQNPSECFQLRINVDSLCFKVQVVLHAL